MTADLAPHQRLRAIRQRLGLSQTEFAQALGLKLRSLQEIEAGGACREAYLLAAEYLALQMAVTNKAPTFVGEDTQALLTALAKIKADRRRAAAAHD